MEKKIRKAIRAYLIKDGKVLAITYNKENIGYYDIPGGKIEDGETPEETSIREFKEETGMTIIKQHHVGHGAIEYPDRIYDFEIFIVDDFEGNPSNEEENNSLWIDADELLNKEKVFGSVHLLKYLKDGMDVKIECDENHKILNIES